MVHVYLPYLLTPTVLHWVGRTKRKRIDRISTWEVRSQIPFHSMVVLEFDYLCIGHGAK